MKNHKNRCKTIKKSLERFEQRKKPKKLLNLEGKIELSYTLDELIERRREDIPR